MFKKFPLVMFVFLPIIMAAGCSNQQKAVTDADTQATTEKQLTIESVIRAFKDAGIPIGSVITYDANTDSNQLLGRPGQYIAKAKWADQRIKQSTYQDADLKGGGIEIFDSQESLNKRWEYLAGFQDSALLGFYMYKKGNAIVRLELDLTPEQAAQYEAVLNSL